MSKVFEKVLLSRLSWLAKAHNWFNERQHGFREGKSTESAAHHLVTYIENAFTKGQYTATAFIDIQSTFDRASHQAILAALGRKGCPAYLFRIIASFLSSRKAILFNETKTFEVELHTGCPQGSVLSAFLWLVLVDDVLQLPFDFDVLSLAYADDITLATSHTDPSIATAHLQAICAAVENWASSVDLSINSRKTTFMLFSRKRSPPPSVSLQLDGQSIQPVLQFLYFGFLLDHRLNWQPHVQAKCLSAKKLFFSAKRHLSVTWGLTSQRLRKLNISSIEPMLLYGCSLWCPAIDKTRTLTILKSTQRSLTLVILRVFKSTSMEACLALSHLLPIELRIAELAASRFLRLKPTFSPCAANTIRRCFPLIDLSQSTLHPMRFFSPLFPPWAQPSLRPLVILPRDFHLPLLPPDSSTMRIYTDGSVIGGCTGYGRLVCSHTCITATCRGKLPYNCSVFQAEGEAILQGLLFASATTPQPKSVEIFSDSRAALLSSLSADRINSPFTEIRTLLYSLANIVQLFWIAGHQGHTGNEIADRLAKQGALGPGTHTDYLPPPVSSIRLLLHRQVVDLWEAKWANSVKASVTRSFFPSIDSTKHFKKMDLSVKVIQLLSGHSRLRSFMFRTTCATSPLCLCGKSEETVDHFLFHCNHFNELRGSFKETSVRFCHMWPPHLQDIPRHKNLFSAFISFVVKSSHADRHDVCLLSRT